MSGDLPRVAFWLVPDARCRSALQPVIATLAGRFAAPVFLPHVTLYSCARTPDQAELALLVRLAGTTGPLTLVTAGLATAESLARTLFLRLAPHPGPAALHRALQAGIARPSSYRFDPHLSLLYQALPPMTRAALVEELAPPIAACRCDELRAVAIPERLDEPDAFGDWPTLVSVRLSE